MSEPKALATVLKGFVAQQFATAAESAYQQVCAELNTLVNADPARKPELDIIHANALSMRDTLIAQGELIEKVYALADANRKVADQATMAYAILEEAVIEQDDNNPLVGRLIDDVQEEAYGEYGYDPDFTDQVNHRIAERMADTIKGIDPLTASKFIEIIGSGDELLPEEIEEQLVNLLRDWAANGYRGEE